MKFRAEIDIMPLKALLDPQGKAVTSGLKNLGLSEVADVRIGKHITMILEADNQQAAESKTEEACKKLLANQIMESFNFKVLAAE
jgi:phosphoribosylformylglycinamidine synthase subunit PurS